MQTVKIWKCGNSLAIRVNSYIAKQLSLKEGSELEVKIEGNQLVLKPKNLYTLEELLVGMTPENCRYEDVTDMGPPVGNEVW